MHRKAGLVMTSVLLAASVAGMCRAQDGFTDHGVGANVAEGRGVVTTRTSDGRCLVIANALDNGPRGYVVVTDVDSRKTTQIFCPDEVPQSAAFGSILASNGRFYTAQGGVILEFDPASAEWTYHGRPSTAASCYLSFTEDTSGKIWGGGYSCALVSFDPDTKATRDYGLMDKAEKYLNSLADDDSGWIYGGIGTARCNIVACNMETGEMVQLLPEDQRVHGTASVYPSTDGTCYGVANRQHYRLHKGQATPIEAQEAGARRAVGSIYWGARTGSFPDGRKLTGHDLPGKWLRILDPKTGTTERIEFDYTSAGVMLTSLGEGPNGVVYASTCHPMHLLALDTKAAALRDFGPIPKVGGGNFCAIASQGNLVIGAQYSAGRLWAYDVTEEWRPGESTRAVLGVPAERLVQEGTVTNGHFTHLKGHDIAFLCGDEFGAEGNFNLVTPDDGAYFLHVLPYHSPRYCDVQFLLNGKAVGDVLVGKRSGTEVGEMQIHGPFELKAGEHRLTVRTLETQGQEPWFGIVTADLCREKRDTLVKNAPSNPRVLAQWHRDICRPRTALAHPDGEHVMMAGFAGYGLCGGGIGIYNLETGEETLLTADEHLLAGHSCITLKALPNGDLVGGTSIAAPGGGHTTAKEGELFIIDWATKKLVFHCAPVAGDANINSIHVAGNGKVYGLSSNSTFFVFDPVKKAVVHSESYREYGGVPRHALHLGPDGMLYAMLSTSIVRIDPETLAHEKLAASPVGITAGGALANGLLCFASKSHVWSYRVPGL